MDLLCCIQDRDIDMVKLLIEKKSDVNIRSRDGTTPIILATIMNEHKIVSLLLDNNADPHIFNTSSKNAFTIAHENVYKSCLSVLNDYQQFSPRFVCHVKYDVKKDNLLIRATRCNNIKMVMFLINKKYNLDLVNGLNETALIIACKYNYIDIAMELILHNANLTMIDSSGHDALLNSMVYSTSNLVKFILEHKFDPNTFYMNNITPLMIVCKYNYEQYIKLLINYKANISLKTMTGETALSIAEKSGSRKCIYILKQYI